MYKTLGRRVAKCPEIARPERNKKVLFDWAFVIAFTRENGEIKRHKQILKGSSRNNARKIANSIIQQKRPEYISIIYKDMFRGPEMIFERGNKRIVDEWLNAKRRD